MPTVVSYGGGIQSTASARRDSATCDDKMTPAPPVGGRGLDWVMDGCRMSIHIFRTLRIFGVWE